MRGGFLGALRNWLAYPLTKGLDIDDPHTTELRRQIIQEKQFLYRIYDDWYRAIAALISANGGPVLELGSGGGFLHKYIPNLIRSEIFLCTEITVVLDGQKLPFANGSLACIVLCDVLHHIPDARSFLREAARCIRPGGMIVMNEPWNTRWARLVYSGLHHEPFDAEARDWVFPANGPLSSANGALPWIIFERDRALLERDFPEWCVEHIQLHTPFKYLVSGGVSMRSLTPSASFPLWKAMEQILNPWMKHLGMFALVSLRRNA